MSGVLAPLLAMPGYGLAALVILLLYGIQSEVRFGARARAVRAGPADRYSTLALSLAAVVPVLGFVLAMKAGSPSFAALLPEWFRGAAMPGLPATAWAGVAAAACGAALRLWAVLTLRERYTRTLLVGEEHPIERGGPYRFVRHPGYLGSLLCLNGVALASGNWVALVASLAVTITAYMYRIKAEDEMLVARLGAAYARYREQVGALFPRLGA